MTDQEKTAELLNLMDALCDANFAKNSSEIDNWIFKLNRIYANEYRHAYSDIFFKLQQIISAINGLMICWSKQGLNSVRTALEIYN